VSAPVLSRANAVRTALALLDAEGAGALTMRRVARDMGVPLMSLYRHVPSKDELEAAVVAALVGGVRPAPRTGAWDADLRAWAAAYREMVRSHPNAVPLLASRPAVAYASRADDVEATLAALGEAGLDPAAARLQLRAALITITGFCNAQEAARGAGTPGPAPDDHAHPMLAALIDDVRAGRHADQLFATMLDAVIGGIATSLSAARRGRREPGRGPSRGRPLS
jgi:TetR/AcrR family transcriptional regulator, tetracycline repressor protein